MSTMQIERPKRQTLKIAQPQREEFFEKNDVYAEIRKIGDKCVEYRRVNGISEDDVPTMEEIVAEIKQYRREKALEEFLVAELREWADEIFASQNKTGKNGYVLPTMEGIVENIKQTRIKWRDEIATPMPENCC